MKAMIFAAGVGSRLKPITDTLPKALVPISGEPLLKLLIDKLKSYGYSDVVINLHHFALKIREYVKAESNFGINISFSDESDLLRNTGGAIKHATEYLKGNEPFLVHNVDILSNLDLDDFYDYHLSNSISIDTPLATILVSDRKTTRYFLFDSANNLVGWMNLATGQVKSPFEYLRREADIEVADPTQGASVTNVDTQDNSKSFDYEAFLQKHNLRKYAFAGVHILSPYSLTLMESYPERFSIVDFYLDMADKYNIKGYVAKELKFVDVGKIDSIKLAEDFIKTSQK